MKADWVSLKYLARVNGDVLPETTDPESTFRYIDIGSISDSAITVQGEMTTFAAAPSRARRLAPPGATVISTVRTYLRAVACVPVADVPMVFSTGFATLEAKASLDARFLYYACRSDAFIEEVVARSTGVSYPAITATDLASIAIPVPPLEEQRRIADFLDDQVALLDRAVVLRQQQIALLAEVDHSRTSVLLAGVGTGFAVKEHPVVGAVRADWAVLKLKRVLLQSGVGVVVNPSTYFADEGVPFVHGNNVRAGWLDLSDVKRISQADSDGLRRSQLQGGDVVIMRVGYPGRAAVVPPELAGANCASVLLLRPDQSQVAPEWLTRFLNGPQGRAQVEKVQYGAAQGVVNLGDVTEFYLPVPPVAEQRSLMETFERTSDAERSAARLMTQSLDLLRERKHALIAATVMGELDVTTARKVSPHV